MSAPKPLWKTFLRFLAPLMLSNALQSLFGTVSNVYLGQMIGVDALAAVSAFFPVSLRHGPEHRRHRTDRPGFWRG
ncbi:Na+-driven multidrug efflux pump [Bradyrhizobium sp. USDA 377]